MTAVPSIPRLTLYTPRGRQWGLFTLSVAAAIFAAEYAYGKWDTPENDFKMLMRFCTLLFPIAACVHLGRLLVRRPALVVDSTGILIRQFGGKTFVAWGELRALELIRYRHSNYLGLILGEPVGSGAFRWSWLKRWRCRFKLAYFGAHYLIKGIEIDCSLADLQSAIQTGLDASRGIG